MIGGKVRKIRNKKEFGIYVNGKLHSTHPTRRHAKKCLCGGMPMQDMTGSLLHNISTFIEPTFPLDEEIEDYSASTLAMRHGLPVHNRIVRDANTLSINRLHNQFQEVSQLSFGNMTTWTRYDQFIASTGMTELQVAQLPTQQRRRMIRDFIFPSMCVASGRFGGMDPPDERPIYRAKKYIKANSLAEKAFDALPREQQQAWNRGEHGEVPVGRHNVRGRHLIPALTTARQERIQGANYFTRLPPAHQIAIIDDENLDMEGIKLLYRISGVPIPFQILQRFPNW